MEIFYTVYIFIVSFRCVAVLFWAMSLKINKNISSSSSIIVFPGTVTSRYNQTEHGWSYVTQCGRSRCFLFNHQSSEMFRFLKEEPHKNQGVPAAKRVVTPPGCVTNIFNSFHMLRIYRSTLLNLTCNSFIPAERT